MEIRPYRVGTRRRVGGDAAATCECWNAAMPGVHGYFPITPNSFRSVVVGCDWFDPDDLLLAWRDGEVIGMIHVGEQSAPLYANGGVIAVVAVRPEERRRGVGAALMEAGLDRLRRIGARTPIDGCGTFPFSLFYADLIDGSERSGPELGNAAALSLFEAFGFRRDRESLMMRRDVTDFPERPDPELAQTYRIEITPRDRVSWLDMVFRERALYDVELEEAGGRKNGLSRCIFGRIDGLSDFTGREVASIFGVETPASLRGRGLATDCITLTLHHLAGLGFHEAELHVYADNTPAVRLYEKTGFVEIGTTVSLSRTAAP